jgi:3-hydroxyisobutyrate dehydrogenase-like beta-hydroxyacid dehydrogenase
MTTAPLSVACLGLGRIGAGIAQSIQRAGHRLIVYNRTPEKMQTLIGSGATASRSPRGDFGQKPDSENKTLHKLV